MKFMQIKPQKARGKFQESLWTDPAWSAENKFDGDRRIMQVCDGFPRFTGTRQSVDGGKFVEKTDCLPHFGDSIKALEGTVLDGEIVAPWAAKLPGGESKWVTSIMGSDPERAAYLQSEKGYLEYMVFDCLWYKGVDIRSQPLSERRDLMYEAVRKWGNPHAKAVFFYYKESEKRAEWARAREGLVFKHADHTYGQEKLWVKLKKEFTADVICTEFIPGKGKYAGSVGAIIFGQYFPWPGGGYRLTDCGSCSGFTDAQRNRLSTQPKKYLGRVMEIKHNGREPTGAFRHPRFAWKWRDDKDPKDCVYREDET